MKRIILILFIPLILFAQNNLDNKFRLAKIFLQNGETEKAKQILVELNSVQPWNQTYLQELNNLYLSNKEYKASIDLLSQRIAANPKDLTSYGLLGSTYFIMGETDMAYSTWDKALSAVSLSPNIYRILANYPIENRAFEKAIEYLKKGANQSADPTIFSFDLASLYTATMNYKLATEEYCKLLSYQSQQLEIVKSRILSILDRQDASEVVLKVVEEYFQKSYSKEFTELYFSVLIHLKKFEFAYSTIIDLHKKSMLEPRNIVYFGNLFLNAKSYSLAKKSFEYYLSLNESSQKAEAKIGLAKSLESELNDEILKQNWMGEKLSSLDSVKISQYKKLISLYSEIENTFPNSETSNESLFRQADIYFSKLYDYEKALSGFEKLSSKFPFSKFAIAAKEKAIYCKALLNRFDEAETDISNFPKYPRVTNDNLFAVNFLLAKIKFWKAEFSKSIELLSSVIENLINDDANDALELSMIISFNQADSLNLSSYAKADFLFEQRNFVEAEKIFAGLAINDQLILLSKLSKFRLAEIKIATNDFPNALSLLKEISDEEISFLNDKCAFLQGSIFYFVVKDYAKARIAFNNLLEKYPNSIFIEKTRELVNQIDAREKENL